MASKAPKAAFNGAHTAGIYADMTVDGPEIGTLVAVIDRAKNLPNRKSMGKQDPYCAARLGKEAKKTETDKRGGQTPKWDQELRFTVHESPDYYTLKVSVFNDDKKTEIIGEARIGLEEIIVPGGRQSDKWHNLHCKGRYAGEIRIELTYYDSRPKEEKVEQRRQETAVNDFQDQGRDTTAGPRELSPTQRRPLPADPIHGYRPGMPDHSHSSPLPHTPSSMGCYAPSPQEQASQVHGGYRTESTPHSGSRYERVQHPTDHSSPSSRGGYDSRLMDGNAGSGLDSYQHVANDLYLSRSYPLEMSNGQPFPMQEEPQSYMAQVDDLQNNNLQTQRDSDHRASLPVLPSHLHRQSLPEQPLHGSCRDQYSRPQHFVHQGGSMPDFRVSQSPHIAPNHQRYSSSVADGENDWPSGYGHINGSIINPDTPNREVDDEAPPPPPAHRTNSFKPSPQTHGRVAESYPPISGTAPLNIRKERASFSNSPLSQVQTTDTQVEYDAAMSMNHAYSQSSVSTPSRYPDIHSSRTQQPRSTSPTRNVYALPQSLTAGYERNTVMEVPKVIQRHRDAAPQDDARDFVPRHQQAEIFDARPRAHHSSSIPAESPLQAVEQMPNRRPHRASIPVITPRPINSDPRTPKRKSVSPQPEPTRNELGTSAIPFGPDSYDAFNPYVNGDSSINSSGARYTTPDQAREAAIQHDREQRLGDGPIIGSDGRVIDPSDHLPTETWAPEPEQKPPKKTAQVNLRFRHSPQGAQPMPPSSRRHPHDPAARPQPISTFSSAPPPPPENVSPTAAAAARNRLQKKSRASPAQPNSSPVVPTVSTALQNPVLRSTASDYPLKEHENYGYGSSPTYARTSSGGIAPPVPSKVPLGVGQEDWGRDALSEELRRIDIGVGGGRARRTRYGW
ncbi:MAG: hypothetical protein Q9167_002986 [Letrouitia subvulpina]